jgi:multicomponent Na+:H+ antiporter subunit E
MGDATVAAGTRGVGFFAFWTMLSGTGVADVAIGLATAAAAAWISVRLLPPAPGRPRLATIAWLVLRFFRQSGVAGFDVARRALDPALPLRPGLIVCPLQLPPGPARSAFCALSSLLPGTVPAGQDASGRLLVHCLDVGQPVAADLRAEEALFRRALGR